MPFLFFIHAKQPVGSPPLTKSHYNFKKRKKELKRQQKQEEKRQRRLAKARQKAGLDTDDSLEAAVPDESEGRQDRPGD